VSFRAGLRVHQNRKALHAGMKWVNSEPAMERKGGGKMTERQKSRSRSQEA